MIPVVTRCDQLLILTQRLFKECQTCDSENFCDQAWPAVTNSTKCIQAKKSPPLQMAHRRYLRSGPCCRRFWGTFLRKSIFGRLELWHVSWQFPINGLAALWCFVYVQQFLQHQFKILSDVSLSLIIDVFITAKAGIYNYSTISMRGQKEFSKSSGSRWTCQRDTREWRNHPDNILVWCWQSRRGQHLNMGTQRTHSRKAEDLGVHVTGT